LAKEGFEASILMGGDMDPSERDEIFTKFKN
jgi:hypothetical protein